ncbi:hypothetical protein C9J40_20045 [Photobacterium sp. GB-72]|nr:hypothetical protein C9J40_20045 [Photobacterium sp. GB-72]
MELSIYLLTMVFDFFRLNVVMFTENLALGSLSAEKKFTSYFSVNMKTTSTPSLISINGDFSDGRS